jgi:hypothetical protein
MMRNHSAAGYRFTTMTRAYKYAEKAAPVSRAVNYPLNSRTLHLNQGKRQMAPMYQSLTLNAHLPTVGIEGAHWTIDFYCRGAAPAETSVNHPSIVVKLKRTVAGDIRVQTMYTDS